MTPERLREIAPDEATYQRSLSLQHKRCWLHAGSGSQRYIWGTINLQGRPGYRAIIDTQTLRHACTCPVRNTPCKHVIGLMGYHAASPRQEEILTQNATPRWVVDWVTKEQNRAQAKAPSATPDDLAAKHEAALAKRIAEMRPGIAEFKTWLHDLIRRGLASVEREPHSFWEDAATRLVDSKARSAADILSAMPNIIEAHDNWHSIVFQELTKLYAMASAFEHLEYLPEPLRYDVLKVAGYTFPKRYFDILPSVTDTWEVHGLLLHTNYNGMGIHMRRTWLRGQRTGKAALLLEFNFGQNAFAQQYTVGTAFSAEMVFYPSQYPLRIQHVNDAQDTPLSLEEFPSWSAGHTIHEMLTEYAQAIGSNPWVPQFPVWLAGLTPVRHEGRLYLRDADGTALPVNSFPDLDWQLLALSGGQPLALMGEWDGSSFLPMSVALPDRILSLSTVTLRRDE